MFTHTNLYIRWKVPSALLLVCYGHDAPARKYVVMKNGALITSATITQSTLLLVRAIPPGLMFMGLAKTSKKDKSLLHAVSSKF
jgi:hypothetical protein